MFVPTEGFIPVENLYPEEALRLQEEALRPLSTRGLYQKDCRRGDVLLQPQRWCNRQWQLIISAPINSTLDALYRIASIIKLIFLTVPAYFIGFVGVLIKACHSSPSLPSPFPPGLPAVLRAMQATALVAALPRYKESISMHIQRIETTKRIRYNTDNTSRAVTNMTTGNHRLIDSLPKDLLINIMTYLSFQDQLTSTHISKAFYQIMRSPIPWRTVLKILNICQDPSEKQKDYRIKNTIEDIHPLKQIKAYKNEILNIHGVYKEYNTSFRGILDKIVRQTRAGPLALMFTYVSDTSSLDYRSMQASFIYGRSRRGPFFALRLKNPEAQGESKHLALIFVATERNCHQIANSVWPSEGQLTLNNEETVNYLLAVISRKPLDRFQPKSLYPNLELV